MKNIDVLIFTAHPDDAEIGIGGTIAKLTSGGFSVGIIDLTEGELGTRGNAITRAAEAKAAAEILNITLRENLSFPDGNVRPSQEYVAKVVSKIRQYKPQIIIAPYFNDRHPDHIGAGKIVKEAMFFSGLPKFETFENGKLQEAYRPRKLFYFMMTYLFDPTFIIDVTDTIETKMKAIRAFKSQFHDPESDEPETFISHPEFLKNIEARARHFGFQIGKTYGEPFFCEEKIEFDFGWILNKPV